MNNLEFKARLISVLKLRSKLTRQELVDLLNVFWKHNKELLSVQFQYYCYHILTSLLKTFDSIVLESNNRYFYVYKEIFIKKINSL